MIYKGQHYANTWYGMHEGPDSPNGMLRNLRLAHLCRRQMLYLLAMDGLGTVAVVEEVI